jgi:hypothetical protein
VCTKVQSENPQERECFGDIDIDYRTILKWILKKYELRRDVDWIHLAQVRVQRGTLHRW